MGRVQRLPLLDGAGVFAPDVLRGEFDVEHGGRDLRVNHQLLQGRQGHRGPHNIRPKGVPQTVRVGMRDSTAHSMMTKKRAESGCGYGTTALSTLRAEEQRRGVGKGTFAAM